MREIIHDHNRLQARRQFLKSSAGSVGLAASMNGAPPPGGRHRCLPLLRRNLKARWRWSNWSRRTALRTVGAREGPTPSSNRPSSRLKAGHALSDGRQQRSLRQVPQQTSAGRTTREPP